MLTRRDTPFPAASSVMLNAVSGYPLNHTWSPRLHELIYKAMGINAVMKALPNRDIEAVIEDMRSLPINLLAVTLPHKQEVMKYLDAIDETAKKIGAVNTVINRNGKLYGYNTDVIGIEHALKNTPIKDKNILVIGAGGAARPLCWFLGNHEANIFCYNRTPEKAEELMREFGGNAMTIKELKKAKIDVIVNATPVGMSPHINESPLPENILRKDQVVFDFIYNPTETKLIQNAKKVGAKTVSGLTMLVAQALAQVQLWLGEAPDYQSVEKEFMLNISSA